MNKKLIMLSLGLGLILIGCQSDTTSDSPEEVNEIQDALKEEVHDVNKIHEMPRDGFDDGFRLHEPGAFLGALSDCDTYQHYNGGEKLTVFPNKPQAFHGEIEVTTININDDLNICGTLLVKEDININYGGVFNIGGEMTTFGDVTVIYGGHLNVQGTVVIEGDLVLRNGASLEFLGEENSLEVLGNVNIAKGAILGEYVDINGKTK